MPDEARRGVDEHQTTAAVSTHGHDDSVTDSVDTPTPTFVVECYWPDISEHQAEAALADIGLAQGTADTPNRVCPLGCILVPADGMALFLVSSKSAETVREAGESIQLPFDRIVESISITVTPPS
jgi:hypothetical protein